MMNNFTEIQKMALDEINKLKNSDLNTEERELHILLEMYRRGYAKAHLLACEAFLLEKTQS